MPERRKNLFYLISGLAWAGLIACGSGSSGFRPRPAELAAILESAEAGTCTEAPGGIRVCARFAEPGEGAVCESPGPGCEFEFELELTGFEPGTLFLGAVEPQDLSLLWRTSTAAFGPADASGMLSARVRFVTDIAPGTVSVIALLPYPPGLPPPLVDAGGSDVSLLADLGAPEARILADWLIEAPPP
jgi:hypothetical protein